MRIRLSVFAAVLAAAGAGSVVLAQTATDNKVTGSADAGAGKAATCLACHGPNGNSVNPQWPKLAGQQAHYIVAQLRLFKSGKRVDTLMSPMAAALSEQDMADLAAYYSKQNATGQEADPSYWKAGEKLYRGGDAARKIPACIACHGPSGHGNGPAGYPALRAQHSVYTQKQLTDYASGARPAQGATTPQSDMMKAVAHRLTAEDIRNVASYIQGMR